MHPLECSCRYDTFPLLRSLDLDIRQVGLVNDAYNAFARQVKRFEVTLLAHLLCRYCPGRAVEWNGTVAGRLQRNG